MPALLTVDAAGEGQFIDFAASVVVQYRTTRCAGPVRHDAGIVHGAGPLLNRVHGTRLLLIMEPATVVPVFPVTVPVLLKTPAVNGDCRCCTFSWYRCRLLQSLTLLMLPVSAVG